MPEIKQINEAGVAGDEWEREQEASQKILHIFALPMWIIIRLFFFDVLHYFMLHVKDVVDMGAIGNDLHVGGTVCSQPLRHMYIGNPPSRTFTCDPASHTVHIWYFFRATSEP